MALFIPRRQRCEKDSPTLAEVCRFPKHHMLSLPPPPPSSQFSDGICPNPRKSTHVQEEKMTRHYYIWFLTLIMPELLSCAWFMGMLQSRGMQQWALVTPWTFQPVLLLSGGWQYPLCSHGLTEDLRQTFYAWLIQVNTYYATWESITVAFPTKQNGCKQNYEYLQGGASVGPTPSVSWMCCQWGFWNWSTPRWAVLRMLNSHI